MVIPEDFTEVEFCFETKPAIFLGRRLMLFDHRLTGGFVEDWFFPERKKWPAPFVLDISFGDKMLFYFMIQSTVKYLIEKNPRDDPFRDIPRYSNIRPFYNDPVFMDRMNFLLAKTLEK